ncbi:MAG: hypothetical protein KDA91_20020 [Planctomycetaceae bacterium]|nr:hypothetical protein [Planctomycetaceae bacterium]
MKLAYLTEVAALMAAHNEMFIEQAQEIPNDVVGDYYILCRNRFNRWMRDLSDLESGLAVREPLDLIGLTSDRPATRSIAEQVMINEMVSRIWTILLIARDRRHQTDRTIPLAHNVFLGHLTVRHKALSVCLSDPRMSQDDIVDVDKLRASTERWTDMLCCHLMHRFDLWQYAFDQDRAREFLNDRVEQQALSYQSQAWILILAGMRYSFPDRDGLAAPVHEDDRTLARLMLSSFPENSPEMAFWMSSKLRQARSV